MSIRKLDRSFAPANKEIRYLTKTFAQYDQNLRDFAKVYFPDTYSDFNEASPGSMFIGMAAYVGDVLSYYIDTQFRENLLQYAEEPDNVIAIAQAFGYKPKPSSPSITKVEFYQLCPATGISGNYEPDSRYLMRLAPNTVITSTDGVNFRTTSETNFGDANDREITVYSISVSNIPLMYLVKKTVKAVAGDIKTYKTTFGDPQRFSSLSLPEDNVLEVISVVDSNGYQWYEVDYLAQDLIFDAKANVAPISVQGVSTPPTYIMKVSRTARRFVTRYDSNFRLELHFGSGVLDDTDASINLQPGKIASDEYQENLASTSLDPSDFLSSKSYGLSPSNAELTVTYSVGGGLASNVSMNSINKISTVEVLNDRTILGAAEQALFNDVVRSLAVNNSEVASGGKDADSVEEIRQNALAFFNSQNRLVTAHDYTVRAYAMPQKFGACAKVFVAEDSQINTVLQLTNDQAPTNGIFATDLPGANVVNMYLLGYDQTKKLTTLNPDVKLNLRTYLDQYRILTDEIRLLDAFVVNIGVNFQIVVFKNYNMNEVLARCIDAAKHFFDVDRWQINQPIILRDLITEIGLVDGVQSVTNVSLTNKYRYRDGAGYGAFIYDIAAATQNGIVYPSLDPCIFEVRYPENDIVGSALQ